MLHFHFYFIGGSGCPDQTMFIKPNRLKFLVFFNFLNNFLNTFLVYDRHRLVHFENVGMDAANGSKIGEHARITYAPPCVYLFYNLILGPRTLVAAKL